MTKLALVIRADGTVPIDEGHPIVRTSLPLCGLRTTSCCMKKRVITKLVVHALAVQRSRIGMRTWDALKISTAINSLLGYESPIDPIEWLIDPANIVLENDRGDLAVFEYAIPDKKIYSGHYYFQSRGRAAINAAKEFLDELFNTCYNIDILMGFVPLEYKASRWLTRQVGFTSYGPEEIRGTEYEMFILTKKEFNHG